MSMNQSNNQIIKKNLLIICRGAGDLATGIIHRLHRAGHRVIALETDYPAASHTASGVLLRGSV